MLRYTLLLGAFATLATAAQFDPPDLNLEFQLHRQYEISRGEQPQNQQGLLESYRLQQGESLWGLSQMLYGDGNYWPKVWAQNQSITNPHLIRPGHTLQFLMGSEDDTPAFRFSEADDSGVELAAASGGAQPQIQVPPPEIAPRPVIKVPSTFPEWQREAKDKPDKLELDDTNITIQRLVHKERILITSYVQEKELEPVGNFLETERESGLVAPMQYVYVKINKGAGKVGEKFVIVKDMGKIRKLNDQVEGRIHARFIEVYGDIELTELTPPTLHRVVDSDKYDIFRALVHHAINLTLTDYELIPGQVQSVDLTADGPTAPVTAQVIGSNKHLASALYGPGDIVFLNKGSQDGLAPGQLLDIFVDRSIRDDRTPITFALNPSGLVKIANVSTTCATAVVLRSVDSIQQGDRVQPRVGKNVAPVPASGDEPIEPPPEAIPDSGGDLSE